MRRVMGLLAVAAVAVALTGCGGGGGDFSSPKATFETMRAAAEAGNKEAFLACFDEATRKGIAEMEKLGKEMAEKSPKATEGAEKGADEFMAKMKGSKFEYGEAKIDGDKATMDVTMNGDTETVKFAKVDGQWKISVPEIQGMVEMMKGMSQMMKGMGEQMKKGMEEGMKGMGEAMKKGLEGAMKKAQPKEEK